ncbi:GNAT family N-acetyltransferase [Flavobacteriaceae bacterium]|nr:GNAT family N-acetyltransferase [Flavobacteriaceae bacterium]
MEQIQLRVPLKKEYIHVNNLVSNAFEVKTAPVDPEFFLNPNIYCFVASVGDEILGTASLHIIQKSNRKMGLIEDVVVETKAQGMGIGKKLIEKLIQTAANQNCYKTILNSTEENAGFYTKLKFKKEQLQFTFRH